MSGGERDGGCDFVRRGGVVFDWRCARCRDWLVSVKSEDSGKRLWPVQERLNVHYLVEDCGCEKDWGCFGDAEDCCCNVVDGFVGYGGGHVSEGDWGGWGGVTVGGWGVVAASIEEEEICGGVVGFYGGYGRRILDAAEVAG